MKYFDWNSEKNEELKLTRGVSFEEIVFHLMGEGLIEIIEHPHREKYKDQKVFIANVENYIYLVPFVESEDTIFLKTIIPSRKMTRKYLGGAEDEKN